MWASYGLKNGAPLLLCTGKRLMDVDTVYRDHGHIVLVNLKNHTFAVRRYNYPVTRYTWTKYTSASDFDPRKLLKRNHV